MFKFHPINLFQQSRICRSVRYTISIVNEKHNAYKQWLGKVFCTPTSSVSDVKNFLLTASEWKRGMGHLCDDGKFDHEMSLLKYDASRYHDDQVIFATHHDMYWVSNSVIIFVMICSITIAHLPLLIALGSSTASFAIMGTTMDMAKGVPSLLGIYHRQQKIVKLMTKYDCLYKNFGTKAIEKGFRKMDVTESVSSDSKHE